MVDLGVCQKHARDRRRANAVDLPGCERLELLARVRRGVYEKPGPLGTTDSERRLCARPRPGTPARRLARLTTAVPLWKPSAGGRAENPNADRCLPVVVEGDLAAEVDELELGLDPRRATALRLRGADLDAFQSNPSLIGVNVGLPD
jgi:hypothetical protein